MFPSFYFCIQKCVDVIGFKASKFNVVVRLARDDGLGFVPSKERTEYAK